jgi:hypothetical protein
MIFKTDATVRVGESMTCEVFEDSDDIKCSGDRALTPMGSVMTTEDEPGKSVTARLR